jgi:peptidoglycan/LPS O-acetylase OafA/YrhL
MILEKRYFEIDSLRGIAALTVVFNHFFNVIPAIYNPNLYPNENIIKILKFTPIHIIWSGHEAVILFFVLSGFVLALPFLNGKQGTYKVYILKRFFRIYIPYITAILAAIIISRLVSENGIKELGMWFNFAWTDPLSLSSVINHIVLIGDFKNYVFDPVVWSLIHEMRISIIFPLLIFVVMRLNWKSLLVLILLISIVSYNIKQILINDFGYIDYSSSFIDTFHYMSMFVIGTLLAKHLDELKEILIKRNRLKLFLFLLAILFYTYPWWFMINATSFHIYPINDFIISIGAALFIVISLSSNLFSRVLSLGVFKFLGKISYSLYLYHSIILLALINLLYGKINYWIILISALPLAIIVSTMAYYFIEQPAINLGRNIVKRKVKFKSLSKGAIKY